MLRNPFDKLKVFKEDARRSERYIRRACRDTEAQNVEDKISASVAFVRALHTGNTKAASHFQKVYPRLADVHITEGALASQSYRDLLDHILELGYMSVKERMEDLRQSRGKIPEHIYQLAVVAYRDGELYCMCTMS